MAPPIFLLASTAPHAKRHAECIEKINNDLSARFRWHGLHIEQFPTATPDGILQFIKTHGSDIVLFHFGGRPKHFEDLQSAALAKGIPSLPDYLSNLPHLRLVFLSYCGKQNFVDQLQIAGIEAVVGTSHKITQTENDEFARIFHRQFTTTDQTVQEAVDEAIRVAGISVPSKNPYYAGARGNRALRRWWFSRNSINPAKPNVVGNEGFFSEQLGKLHKSWPSVVDSGQAAAMLAFHATALAQSQGRTVDEIQSEFAKWGRQSAKLAEQLRRFGLLMRSDTMNGEFFYHGDPTLDDNIFRNLYTSNTNLARVRQLLANLAFLPVQLRCALITFYRKLINLPRRFWQLCQNNVRILAIVAVVVSLVIMAALFVFQVIDSNLRRVDLAPYVGELSSSTLFALDRQEVEEPPMERALEWLGGYEPLRARDIHFQTLDLLQPLQELDARNAPLFWKQVLFSGDQRLIAANGRTITMWYLSNEPMTSVAVTVGQPIGDVALDRANRNLAYTDGSGQVYLRNLATGAEQMIANHGTRDTYVRFGFGDNAVVSGGVDGILSYYDGVEREVKHFLIEPPLAITALATDSTSPIIAYATAQDNTIHIWHSTDNRPIADLRGHSDRITALEFRQDGQLILSTSQDQSVRLWPIVHGAQAIVQFHHTDQLLNAHFVANTPFIVTATTLGNLQIWHPNYATPLNSLQTDKWGISALATSNNGQLIAAATGEGSIFLWQVNAQAVLLQPQPVPEQ